ncbi:MAG: hypothetical protein F4Z18_06935 [Caldilineaceae bacterium SB0666_bin_21]|nr:hypothetical protein [Caldilineaceae bacterium SB0666_bin_21]
MFRKWLILAGLLTAISLVVIGCETVDTSALENEISERDAKIAELEAMVMDLEATGEMPAEMAGSRLQTVQDRGKLICARRNHVPGYGNLDDAGKNVGIENEL